MSTGSGAARRARTSASRPNERVRRLVSPAYALASSALVLGANATGYILGLPDGTCVVVRIKDGRETEALALTPDGRSRRLQRGWRVREVTG